MGNTPTSDALLLLAAQLEVGGQMDHTVGLMRQAAKELKELKEKTNSSGTD
jgi:hypothetical protein